VHFNDVPFRHTCKGLLTYAYVYHGHGLVNYSPIRQLSVNQNAVRRLIHLVLVSYSTDQIFSSLLLESLCQLLILVYLKHISKIQVYSINKQLKIIKGS